MGDPSKVNMCVQVCRTGHLISLVLSKATSDLLLRKLYIEVQELFLIKKTLVTKDCEIRSKASSVLRFRPCEDNIYIV